jgi:L-asparaginase/Glu-tRNA(Gln) amidotransferase subunit D
VVSSQCAFGQADLSIYEVGRAAMDVGAMSAHDMTSEAALVKLSWVLGHTHEPDRVREMMGISYVGEMSYLGGPDSLDK